MLPVVETLGLFNTILCVFHSPILKKGALLGGQELSGFVTKLISIYFFNSHPICFFTDFREGEISI